MRRKPRRELASPSSLRRNNRSIDSENSPTTPRKGVEDRPGVSESLIERHEEAAERALALFAGLLAAATLLAVRLQQERAELAPSPVSAAAPSWRRSSWRICWSRR